MGQTKPHHPNNFHKYGIKQTRTGLQGAVTWRIARKTVGFHNKRNQKPRTNQMNFESHKYGQSCKEQSHGASFARLSDY